MRKRENPLPKLTAAEIHAAAVHSRMAARIRESRKAEAEYEATLDPRQFQA